MSTFLREYFMFISIKFCAKEYFFVVFFIQTPFYEYLTTMKHFEKVNRKIIFGSGCVTSYLIRKERLDLWKEME